MILLPVPVIPTAIAVIKVAVAVTIEVAVAVTIVYTIPGEAMLMTDVTEATPDGDLAHGTLHTPGDLSNTTASHDLHLNLTEDVNPIHTVKEGPDHPGEDTAIIFEAIMAQSLQITNAPDVLPDLPGRSDNEQLKQSTAVTNHWSHPMKLISLIQLQWF